LGVERVAQKEEREVVVVVEEEPIQNATAKLIFLCRKHRVCCKTV
jgi:hypothetical protein